MLRRCQCLRVRFACKIRGDNSVPVNLPYSFVVSDRYRSVAQHFQKLKETRKKAGEEGENTVVTSCNDEFDRKMNGGFKGLIKQLEERKKGGGEKMEFKPTMLMESEGVINNNVISAKQATVKHVVKKQSIPKPIKPTSIVTPHAPIAPKTPKQKITKPQTQPTPQTRPHTSDGASLIGAWTCGTCTYRNETRTYSGAKCEMCENPRPRPVSGGGRRSVIDLEI